MDVDVSGLKNKIMLKKLFRKNTPAAISPEEELRQWELNGKPAPPPHIVKQKAIKEYQEKYATKVLVETGTYLGDMVEANKNNFEKIYSIELSSRLYQKVLKRFKGDGRIVLLQGDSGKRLSEILKELDQPALFWLDGHYSGGITALGDKECPVPEELAAIFKSPLDHIILIDDARMFDGTRDYPTIEQIKKIIDENKRNCQLEVKDDIIRITPSK
jgi:hypothetical protein